MFDSHRDVERFIFLKDSEGLIAILSVDDISSITVHTVENNFSQIIVGIKSGQEPLVFTTKACIAEVEDFLRYELSTLKPYPHKKEDLL